MKRSLAFLFVTALMIIISGIAFAADRNSVAVDEINADFSAPKPVKTVKPARVFYMPTREIEGYVTLEFTIDEEGRVESAGVLYKTSQLAVAYAIDAASKWEFIPGKLNGKPVRSTVSFSLPFGRNLEILEDTEYVNKVLVDDTTLALLRD